MAAYKVNATRFFEKDLKKLGKKYFSVNEDLKSLIIFLSNGNLVGDRIQGFNARLYKARLKSSDNKKGKSGGFRVIYEVEKNNIKIELIEIYSKSQKSNTDKAEIEKRLVGK